MSAGTATGGRLPPPRPPPARRRTAMNIRVLVADDQSMVRLSFRMLLCGEENIEVVAEASNGLEAVDKAACSNDRRADGHPHAGARRPRGDAAHLAADETRPDPDPHHVRSRRVRSKRSRSVHGFVLKDEPSEQLIAAIRPWPPEKLLSPAITKRVIKEPLRASPRPAPRGVRRADGARAGGLSPDRQRPLQSWRSRDLFISDDPSGLVTHILQKLGLRDRVQAVVLAYRTGPSRPTRGGRASATRADRPERHRSSAALFERRASLSTSSSCTGGRSTPGVRGRQITKAQMPPT